MPATMGIARPVEATPGGSAPLTPGVAAVGTGPASPRGDSPASLAPPVAGESHPEAEPGVTAETKADAASPDALMPQAQDSIDKITAAQLVLQDLAHAFAVAVSEIAALPPPPGRAPSGNARTGPSTGARPIPGDLSAPHLLDTRARLHGYATDIAQFCRYFDSLLDEFPQLEDRHPAPSATGTGGPERSDGSGTPASPASSADLATSAGPADAGPASFERRLAGLVRANHQGGRHLRRAAGKASATLAAIRTSSRLIADTQIAGVFGGPGSSAGTGPTLATSPAPKPGG
ncbi:hypothetical protein H696_03419 [Fonticula alba]|uniref:Uncharacterized protein n=1 Tax=Fonticula alba TaxID=691883 RepID=A0A058Z6S4_FONAL|nr:hypothetical protein H696_03419 [Fonticula alba]KCV69954.1 hypothetical protein H696_03419 [Fonticula alba]|eukprot:XP_009495560.1 hypothetical protein H696_03419 [Fonticula alba]